jgi:acyl phosphate:glycerol-3-phosphate acyltransferase
VTAALALGAAYLVGAVPVGYLVGRAFGIGDIRRHGSGTIGATNVLRTAGRLPAVLTLLGDVVKGWSAVALAAFLSGGDAGLTALSAVAAVVGNCWSIFLGFRGGKGVATGFGALLRLVPLATLPAALLWMAVVIVSRYVSLASLVAAACVPVAALAFARYPGASVLAAAAVAVIVVARHHANIARLLAGNERRLGRRAA